MPIAEGAFGAITPELAEWLDMLVERRAMAIAAAAGIPESTVRNRLSRLEDVAGCADRRELVRWWLDNKKPWLQWILDRLHVDPAELAV
jgi:hypothetical protein